MTTEAEDQQQDGAAGNTALSTSSLLRGLWETENASDSSYDHEDEDHEDYETGGSTTVTMTVEKRASLILEARLLEWVQQQEEKQESEEDDTKDSSTKLSEEDLLMQQLSFLPVHQPHSYPCADTYKKLPAPPTKWPQPPLMLRPTPGTQMKIRGIRYADSTEYQRFPGVCAGCILPVNNGKEPPGKSLVVDFESALFVGTLLMRVKDAPVIDTDTPQTETSYFDGRKRKFQVVIQGRFRQEGIPISECVTGQAFDRAAGKLPARFLVNAFVRFVSTLAPQLEAELDGDRPRFLTPLVATAHTVLVQDSTSSSSSSEEKNVVNNSNLEDDVEEPPADHPHSIMCTVAEQQHQSSSSSSSVTQRRQARKKAFNQVAAHKASEPVFDTSKEYTFEFFQHLLELTDADDFKINMARSKVGLARALNGQPIRIMGARRRNASSATAGTYAQEATRRMTRIRRCGALIFGTKRCIPSPRRPSRNSRACAGSTTVRASLFLSFITVPLTTLPGAPNVAYLLYVPYASK